MKKQAVENCLWMPVVLNGDWRNLLKKIVSARLAKKAVRLRQQIGDNEFIQETPSFGIMPLRQRFLNTSKVSACKNLRGSNRGRFL